MSEWRDVSTAPRDGTPVLLTSGGAPVYARWLEGAWWEDEPPHKERHGFYWFSTHVSDAAFNEVVLNATHWHPLPSPPVEERP